MSIIIKGGHSTGQTNSVTSDGFSGLSVNLPTVITETGYMSLAIEADDGSVISEKTIRPLYITQDFRTSIGIESPQWNDVFCHSVLNNSKYIGVTSVQTITVSGGFLNLNAGNSVSSPDVSRVQTFRTFSIGSNSPRYVNIKAKFSAALQNNSIIEFGLGLATTTATPTDGVFFRASAGTLNAVVNKGGFETVELDVFTPVVGEVYDFLLGITQNNVEFWVDDVIVSRIIPTSVTGSTLLSNALPILLRNHNAGVVPLAIQLNVQALNVLSADIKLNQNWNSKIIGNGQNSIQKPDGQDAVVTGTTSANIVNNVAPTSSLTLSNIVGGYTTLGGDFLISGMTSSEIDYILFSYLNPIGTSTIPGKNLNITSVYISTFTTGATMSAQTSVLQWSMGLGGTATSLLEQDSETLGTRAPRRIGLGIQRLAPSVAAGSMASPMIAFEPSVPYIVDAGTYLNIIIKAPIAAPVGGLFYRGNVSINGYFD